MTLDPDDYDNWLPSCSCRPPYDECDHDPLRPGDPGYTERLGLYDTAQKVTS